MKTWRDKSYGCWPSRKETLTIEITPPPTRRAFLKNTARCVVYGGALVGLYAWRVEPHWLEFTNRELPIANLPPELVGTTLVQISDAHVGDTVDSDYLMDAFRRVAAFEPDWIVFTGDFMSLRRGGDGR